MNLTQYERFKLDLAALLSRREIAGSVYVSARDALLSRLAGDKFNLVTVGRVSRGKSTLMNALLQTRLLPMGIIPLTSVVTLVKYGSHPGVVLYYRGTNLFLNAPLDELEKHITETGNPCNREGISRAEIELPSTLLRYGFCFVDTPGVGSGVADNTATTLNFLPEADALLLVTSFESALSAEEIALLQVAKRHNLEVFLAVNKADLVNEDQKNQALETINKTLAAEKIENVKIFPVSAILGLEQAQTDIDALREAIIQFCVIARQTRFLADIVEKTGDILKNIDDFEGLSRLVRINAQILACATTTRDACFTDIAPRHSCPVCLALGEAAFKAISTLQFQLSQVTHLREDFSKGPGLCALHMVQFGKIANPLAIAQSLADDLEAVIHRLDEAGRDPVSGVCPVCGLLEATEAKALKQQADCEADEAALICLPHLPKFLASLPRARRAQAYHRVIKQYERLAEDLRRYALRREGAQRSAITAEEHRAASDVINTLAGHADGWWSTAP